MKKIVLSFVLIVLSLGLAGGCASSRDVITDECDLNFKKCRADCRPFKTIRDDIPDKWSGLYDTCEISCEKDLKACKKRLAGNADKP